MTADLLIQALFLALTLAGLAALLVGLVRQRRAAARLVAP